MYLKIKNDTSLNDYRTFTIEKGAEHAIEHFVYVATR